MRNIQKTMPLLFSLLIFTTVAQASDVQIGVSVAGEVSPGVYGRIDIGTRPPPPVLYTKPVVIVQQPAVVHAVPLYLHVPPGHAKNWGKHCHKYNACAQPVYFVKSAEYGSGYNASANGGHTGYKGGKGEHKGGHGKGHEGKKGRKD
jgi:hypothetical protein